MMQGVRLPVPRGPITCVRDVSSAHEDFPAAVLAGVVAARNASGARSPIAPPVDTGSAALGSGHGRPVVVGEHFDAPHRRPSLVAVGVSNRGDRMASSRKHDRTTVAGPSPTLPTLLARREALGRRWAEQMVHAVPGTGELLQELTVVEQAIGDRWPRLAARWLTQWVLADAARIHDPDSGLYPGCPYCQASKQTRASA